MFLTMNYFGIGAESKQKNGHTVFISEYSAPNDFDCVKEIQHKTILDKNSQYQRTEKLFRYKA